MAPAAEDQIVDSPDTIESGPDDEARPLKDAGEPAVLGHCTEMDDVDAKAPNGIQTRCAKPVFHERQSGRQCGLHCVNNLLQRRCYEPADLNRLGAELQDRRNQIGGSSCSRMLSKLPGARLFGKCSAAVADYDVQVLQLALEHQGASMKWFDRRKDVQDLDLDDKHLIGIILNKRTWKVPCSACSQVRFEDRHWLSLARFSSGFFNLDSKLSQPKFLGSTNDLLDWLRDVLLDSGSCLFRVVREDSNAPEEAESFEKAAALTGQEERAFPGSLESNDEKTGSNGEVAARDG